MYQLFLFRLGYAFGSESTLHVLRVCLSFSFFFLRSFLNRVHVARLQDARHCVPSTWPQDLFTRPVSQGYFEQFVPTTWHHILGSRSLVKSILYQTSVLITQSHLQRYFVPSTWEEEPKNHTIGPNYLLPNVFPVVLGTWCQIMEMFSKLHSGVKHENVRLSIYISI